MLGFKDDRAPSKGLNTRLLCIVHWLGVNIGMLIKWLNFPHTDFTALRAGRTSNVQSRLGVIE